MWRVMMSENPVDMIHNWLEYCTWVITRFTRCRKITVVYHVKKSKDWLEMVSGKHNETRDNTEKG
jgi:hypothetical protein